MRGHALTRTSTLYSTAFVAVMTALIVACGGGGDPGEVAEPQWTAADEAEVAHIIEVVETLGSLYAKNCPECIRKENDE